MSSARSFACATVLATALIAQAPEFESSLTQVRSLFTTVRKLQEATGWHICIEEPVWPQRTTSDISTRTSFHGNRVNPPAVDVLQVQIGSLRGSGAQAAAVNSLIAAFDNQNKAVHYKVETPGVYQVVDASSVVDASGKEVPATLLLDNVVLIPVAQRTPTGHLQALQQAVQRAAGANVVFDLDVGQIDTQFTGRIKASVATADQPNTSAVNNFSWGTSAPGSARAALIDLLGHSLTTYDWTVFCQVGVNGPDECTLSLRPVTVQVTGASGKATKRAVTFDQGSPDIQLPPPPPE